MFKRPLVIVLLGLGSSGCSHVGIPQAQQYSGADSGRQILVTTRQQESAVAFGLVGDPDTVYIRRRGYGPTPNVDRMLDSIAEDYGLRRVDGWYIASMDVYCEVYELAPGDDLGELLAEIRADSRVDSVQLNNVFETQAVHYDDPYASMQPALSALSIDAAHETATGRGVTIAIIDSQVDGRHPEIRGRVRVSRNLVGDRRSARAEVHGTAIAGIIASMANNAEGIVGVAPDVRLATLRACRTMDAITGRAECSSFALVQAMGAALSLDVDIINLSLSGPRDALLERLIDLAVSRGTIVVAAVPDSDDGDGGFPASHAGVIAAESAGARHSERRDVLHAPGIEVLSTAPDASYGFFSGNSMSAAHISGVSALLIEKRPDITVEEVRRLLAETSVADSINACRAIARLAGSSPCPEVTDPPVVDRAALLRTLQ